MGCRRPRRTPTDVAAPSAVARRLARGLALLSAIGISLVGGAAHADRNDLRLINLCDSSTSAGSCPWVTRTPTSTTVTLDPRASTLFRSLMSELGVVVAPRLQTPADTLGFAGFQLSAELGFTEISNGESARFWNGTEGVQPANPRVARPPAALTTVGAFVRKGMFSPVPALELGAGAVNVLQSNLWALQAYAKVALHEGFHDTPFPSVAIRVALSDLVGTDQVDLKVWGFDALVSKAFSLSGTARVEPFLGWNLLLIDGQSGVIDATPECDAAAVRATNPADPRAVALLPRSCQAQAGTTADLGANFRFPHEDLILRNRIFGGAKVKLWKLFMSAEVAIAPGGSSRDGSAATGRATDTSGAQKSIAISLGIDD